jgi:hypothetical protein
MAEVLLLEKCKGLNTVVDPVRLDYDPKAGVVQLAMAVNVDVDDTGRISRRKGYVELRNEECHSLWASPTGQDVFYVSGNALYRLNKDYTRTGLRSGLTPGYRMSFCQPAGLEIYYSNGVENGKILESTSYSWVGEDYVGPPLIWQVSTIPPVGSLLASIGGYMLIAQGEVLWYSMPFAYSHYALSKDWVQFETPIVVVKALETGVWISDQVGVYWLAGADPDKWMRQLRSSYPAIAGTAVVTDGSVVGEGIPGTVVIWASEVGIFVGDEQGRVVNMTQDSMELWKAVRGSGAVYNGRYICILE